VTSELKPLIDDTSRPAYVRDLLRQARNTNTPRYDFDAGLAKHKALVTTGAPLPDWANSSLTGVTKTTTLISKIVGIASVPVIGGAIAWNVLTPPNGESNAYDTKPSRVADTVQQPLIVTPSDAVQVATDQVRQIGAIEHIESRATPLVQKSGNEATTKKESFTRPLRKRLYHRSPSETVAQPQIATDKVADEEVNDEPTTAAPNDKKVASDQLTAEPLASSTFENEPKEKATPPTDNTLQREIKLLAEARRLVNVSPLRALALARARNPKTGILREEWDQVDLLALIKLGRIEDAKQGVRRFRTRYPNSAFSERLRKELLPSR